jgi:hypothetical protein
MLATYDDEGEIEGVKYRQLTAVSVNAIQAQQEQIAEQQAEIAALKEQTEKRAGESTELPQIREEIALIRAELQLLKTQALREPKPLRVTLDR